MQSKICYRLLTRCLPLFNEWYIVRINIYIASNTIELLPWVNIGNCIVPRTIQMVTSTIYIIFLCTRISIVIITSGIFFSLCCYKQTKSFCCQIFVLGIKLFCGVKYYFHTDILICCVKKVFCQQNYLIGRTRCVLELITKNIYYSRITFRN